MNISVSNLRSQIQDAQASGLLPLFEEAARAHTVPLRLLLAVASRESCIGRCLAPDGTGDNGHGRGIMQVDDRYHGAFIARHANRDDRANIDYGAALLAEEHGRFGRWDHALAAYNSGAGNVRAALAAGVHPDTRTTGRDYSADVLQRASVVSGWLSEQGIPDPGRSAVDVITEPIAPVLAGLRLPFGFGMGRSSDGSSPAAALLALGLGSAGLAWLLGKP